ncbi:MAG: cyclase family protein [Candidatus Rokubacteria bacterium]|nr:cyclase family protein [Candidatus Rokubacteria bacterium]
MTWYDLAHDYHAAMTTQAAVGPPCIENVMTVGKDSFNLQKLTLGSHIGTHVDAPMHFIVGGRTIDTYDLNDLGGPGVILPIGAGPSEAITDIDLEAAGVPVRRGDIVMLATGWDRKFSTPDYHTHPYLAESAAQWLVDHGVKMIGVDFFSADLPVPLRPQGFTWPVHQKLLGAGILIAENVANTSRIAGRRLTIGAFPLKIRGGDGAPARIFALDERA